MRKGMRQEDGQAAGAGADVDRGMDGLGIVHPGRQLFAQQFRNERSRHDHALVHVEAEIAEPGLVRQVGCRHALFYAAFDDGLELIGLAMRQAGVQERLQPVERQMQGMQDEVSRLVEGIVAAVAEEQPGLVEARHREAQPVAQGDEGLGVVKEVVFLFHR